MKAVEVFHRFRLLFIQFLFNSEGKFLAVLLCFFDVLIRGNEANLETLLFHRHSETFKSCDDVRNALAAPAVGAEYYRGLVAAVDSLNECKEIPNGSKGVGIDCGCADRNRVAGVAELCESSHIVL